MKKNEIETTDRRSFLKGATVTAAAVTSGAIAGGTLADSVGKQDKKPVSPDGYHETDHIRAYYRLARF